ncbi:MAG TPA: hypothetical protein H9779_03335 [Candidatus Alistipes avicola]|uniref:Uncharacterized protein n=1 Tax=Candidatus Alistipes avicola TaxID=2838432 RepID=A0A9D2L3G9_9BACT|nr:hypothetical protein [uncultured Alistipes sp.]HJA98618.1 hypothetical protein [Candidatus Alistipes avicola]
MDSKEIIVVIISALAAGILAPMITRWVLKWQKQKRLKLLKDNGKMDMMDEFVRKNEKN